MSPPVPLYPTPRDGFPRVSGDEPRHRLSPRQYIEFSPRERG